MDRLFLRVFVKLLAFLLLGVVLGRVLILPRVNERAVRNLESSVAPHMALAAELLTEKGAPRSDASEILKRVSQRIGTNLVLLPRSELQLEADAQERLARGETVLVWNGRPGDSVFVFMHLEGTGQSLRLGPVNLQYPWGAKRAVAILLLGIGLLSLAVYLLVRPIRLRLAALARTANALGRGELGSRAESEGRDEISALAGEFNRMADEIQRLIASREELLRMTSHELRTPIQRLHFSLDRLREPREAAQAAQALEHMERDLAELDELIEELLTYARLRDHGAPIRTWIEVLPVIEELCRRQAELVPEITLATPSPAEAGVAVQVDARLFRRAILNLIVNALRHARSRVEVTLERTAQELRIHVDDDGSGVPVADRERIFEPFQRLDDERTRQSRGSGLGLAIIRRIAEVHGGDITVLTSDLGGARFQLSLPHSMFLEEGQPSSPRGHLQVL